MKIINVFLIMIVLVGILVLSGCTTIEKPTTSLPNTEEDSATGTSPKIGEDAARAMQFEKYIDDIASITLKDIEGNDIRVISDKVEVASIQQAFNESYIMDTAYIEMITGYTMTIVLEDEREVFIHSYGDEIFIVANFDDGQTYHLGCELIAKMLLEEI